MSWRVTAVVCAYWSVQSAAFGAPRDAPSDRTEAERLKAVGDHAMEIAKPAEALAAYRAAYERDPNAALLYNQARAHMALTNYPQALAFLERFDREAPAALKARAGPYAALIEEVHNKVHWLTLDIPVKDATVRLYDATLGVSPLPELAVNAGHTTLEVRANGYRNVSREVTLAGGAHSTIRIDLSRTVETGTLVIRAAPSGVRVNVDGLSPRNAPAELTLLHGS